MIGLGTFLPVIPSKSLMARALDSRRPNSMAVSCDMKPRILIADDQPDLLDALKLLLKSEGIEYDAVTSPEAALNALNARPVRSRVDGPQLHGRHDVGA